MIFLLLSVLSGDYQNLFLDAENLGMGGIRTSHPLSVFDNPVSSSLNPTSITIHGALNFLGLSRSIAINGGMKRGNRSMGFASIGLNNGALTSGIGLKISQIRTTFSLSLHEELPLTVMFTLSKGFYK